MDGWLDQLAGSSVMDTAIPFTEKTLGDVLDLREALFSAVLDRLKQERIVAFREAPANGKLEKDAEIKLTLNDELELLLQISAADTQDNDGIDDLIEDLSTALVLALNALGLPGGLQVGKRSQSNKLALIGNKDVVDSFEIKTGHEILGFREGQTAAATSFDSAQELIEILAAAVGADYDAATSTLRFTLDFMEALDPLEVPLNFDFDLGSLAEISSDSLITIEAEAGATLTFGINIGELGANFDFQATTDLGTLNSNNGVSFVGGQDDLQVGLKDGSQILINLDGATVVQDVLDAFSSASDNLSATLDQTRKAFNLKDSSEGDETFSVAAVNGSFAALELGLLGEAVDNSDTIQGAPLHGETLSSRFFIENTRLKGSASLTANEINAGARFGFAGIGIEEGSGSISAELDIRLSDPGTDAADGRITLRELFSNLGSSIGDLVNVEKFGGSAAFDLPVKLEPEDLTPPGEPKLVITMSDLFDPDTLTATFDPEFDLLAGLENFAFAQIVEGLRSVQGFISDVEGISTFQDKLPLINQSVAEILELSGRFGRIIDRLESDQPRTIQQVQESIAEAIAAELGITNEEFVLEDSSVLSGVLQTLRRTADAKERFL